MEETRNRWRVVRRSTTTGRVLKVVGKDFGSPHEAQTWMSGFGKDASAKTRIVWERQP